MKIIATTTGSYPPLHSTSKYKDSIKRAFVDQIEAGIDLLVDGQVRSDIAGIFAGKIEGFGIRTGLYPIVRKVTPPKRPITVSDYSYAKKLAGKLPVKAHLTGPTFMAESSSVKIGSGYQSNSDPNLLNDIAVALAREARWLSEAGAEYIQIDEPSFSYGANIDDGLKAIEIITREIKYPILHICGDIRKIMDKLLDAPVHILSVEGQYLRKLPNINSELLNKHNKKIAYGCMRVNNKKTESLRRLQRELVEAIDLFGPDNIWGITPNCGLRLIETDRISIKERLAFNKMKRLAETAHSVESFIKMRGELAYEI